MVFTPVKTTTTFSGGGIAKETTIIATKTSGGLKPTSEEARITKISLVPGYNIPSSDYPKIPQFYITQSSSSYDQGELQKQEQEFIEERQKNGVVSIEQKKPQKTQPQLIKKFGSTNGEKVQDIKSSQLKKSSLSDITEKESYDLSSLGIQKKDTSLSGRMSEFNFRLYESSTPKSLYAAISERSFPELTNVIAGASASYIGGFGESIVVPLVTVAENPIKGTSELVHGTVAFGFETIERRGSNFLEIGEKSFKNPARAAGYGVGLIAFGKVSGAVINPIVGKGLDYIGLERRLAGVPEPYRAEARELYKIINPLKGDMPIINELNLRRIQEVKTFKQEKATKKFILKYKDVSTVYGSSTVELATTKPLVRMPHDIELGFKQGVELPKAPKAISKILDIHYFKESQSGRIAQVYNPLERFFAIKEAKLGGEKVKVVDPFETLMVKGAFSAFEIDKGVPLYRYSKDVPFSVQAAKNLYEQRRITASTNIPVLKQFKQIQYGRAYERLGAFKEYFDIEQATKPVVGGIEGQHQLPKPYRKLVKPPLIKLSYFEESQPKPFLGKAGGYGRGKKSAYYPEIVSALSKFYPLIPTKNGYPIPYAPPSKKTPYKLPPYNPPYKTPPYPPTKTPPYTPPYKTPPYTPPYPPTKTPPYTPPYKTPPYTPPYTPPKTFKPFIPTKTKLRRLPFGVPKSPYFPKFSFKFGPEFRFAQLTAGKAIR